MPSYGSSTASRRKKRMNAFITRSAAALVLALSMGCFHATIETGATPSSVVVEKSFATGWLFGLVPPSTVATAAKCPNGVAKVETQHSFVNQLVSFLTLNIYTPMNIKVTCAAKRTASNGAPSGDIFVAVEDGTRAIQQAFLRAAQVTATSGRPMLVEITKGR
jgi:hypothetical protein